MGLWLRRWTIVVAVLAFAAVLTGGFDTSTRIVLGKTQPGQSSAVHEFAGIAALVVSLGLCLLASLRDARPYLRTTMWLTFGTLAVSAIVVAGALSATSIVVHTVCAHLSVALATAAIVLTSPAWSEPAKPVSPESWKAVRPAALATPAAVLLQITMGALYRHQIIGVMLHILGAMVVAILTLVVSTLLLQHFPTQRQLKSAATALISIALVQISLGIGVFFMVLLGVTGLPQFAWLATSHVCVGTLTLAASVAAAMQVGRFMAPSP
jgi:hypothetical protein